MRPRIFVLVGPTACGKTAASILLAKKLNAEIISADSIQVYRGLDIGSAKPTVQERQGVPHYMLDVADVTDKEFSVAEFQRRAAMDIQEISFRGKLPLVVGGTGLYINALTYPLQFTSVPGDPEIRAALRQQEAEEAGALYKRLQQVDPQSAKRLHPNDSKRIIRALEVYEVSGRTLTSYGVDFANKASAEPPYRATIVGLTMERAALYERIEQRVDDMMRMGLLNETGRLFEAGYPHTLPALQGLGYKQLLRHLRGETTLKEAVEEIKRETRRFAKRQITWFKRDKRIHWLNTADYENMEALCNAMYSIYKQDDGEGEKK